MQIIESVQGDSSNQGPSLFVQDTNMDDLPEDVILSIVSKLNLRDAVNFSVVCKQWAHVPSCLDTIVLASNMSIQLCPGGKDAFVRGVNQFLQHYNKLRRSIVQLNPISLRSFVIFFCLDKHSSTDIDNWISMAIHNGITTLYVQLECALHVENKTHRPYDQQYIFPWQLLNQSPTVLKELFIWSCFFGCRPLTSKLTSLEILEVRDTLITEYDMDTIIQCCQNLQRIAFSICRVPSKLTFAGGSLASLEVLNCGVSKEIEVLSGRALTKFTYSGKCVKFNFISATKLTNLTFNMVDLGVIDYVFQNLRRDFPAMTSLSIVRNHETLPSLSHLHGRMSSFLQLEELKLYLNPASSFSLATMKEMLKACPVLTRLEMVPRCTPDDTENGPVEHLHRCLRFIKISGFCGGKGSVELAKFLVQVSESLQNVVIEQQVEVAGYFHTEHSATWHGEEDPEAVKHSLLNLMRNGQLAFM